MDEQSIECDERLSACLETREGLDKYQSREDFQSFKSLPGSQQVQDAWTPGGEQAQCS